MARGGSFSAHLQGSVFLLAVLLLVSFSYEEASALVSTTSNGNGEMGTGTERRGSFRRRTEGSQGERKQAHCDEGALLHSVPCCFAQFAGPSHWNPKSRLQSACMRGNTATIPASATPILPLRSHRIGQGARRKGNFALRMSAEDEIQKLREEGKKKPQKDAEEEKLRIVLKQLREGLDQRKAAKAQVVARAEELIEKVQGSAQLKEIAGTDAAAPSVESILAKNPQVAALEDEMAQIEAKLLALSPLGLAQLAAPLDLSLFILRNPLLAAGDDELGALVRLADSELRFLSDAELARAERLLAHAQRGSPEGAALRRVAATVMRDFHRSTVEAAMAQVAEECAGLAERGAGGARVVGALETEVGRLLRLSHYAASAGYLHFTDDDCVRVTKELYREAGVGGRVIGVALQALQKRAAFLCKCAKAGPNSWVAAYAAIQHLRDRLVDEHDAPREDAA